MPNLVALCQTMWASVGGSKIWGRWAPPLRLRGVADLLETRPAPRVFLPNLIATDQTADGKLYRRSSEKLWPFASRHSRSLKQTRIDRLPMTFC